MENFLFVSESKGLNGVIPTYLNHPIILPKSNPPQNGGHRRLPATPKKPSTLFSKTTSVAFNNVSTQLPKPSSLALRYFSPQILSPLM